MITGTPLLLMASAWFAQVAPGDPAAADPFAATVRTTPPRAPEEERAALHVPEGFTVELFAAEPDIGKPINLAFDARGRLWISQSREYPFSAPEGRPGRDAIKILEDTDGDGRADRFTTFVEELNIPTGLLPYRRGVIAWSIPNIWYFEDSDGDGRADRREVLYGPLGWEKDTHGMSASFRRGFDGWMYLTHGFNNLSRVEGRDGSRLDLDSGNNYRVTVDGGRVEAFTTGQVNPFGTAFDAEGNLYSADCHTAPIYQLLRGAVYPHFGRPHDGLGFGPVLMQHSHDSTAIAGLTVYTDDRWPAEFRDNIFVGNVMTSRINRDRIERHGSSPRATALPDLVRSDDPWFRPVDVQLGPDGALYVADFYNRIIGHYEVPLDHPGRDRERGRIWRIRYTGAGARPLAQGPALDLARMKTDALARVLRDPNLTLRMLATHELADRGGRDVRTAAQRIVRRRAPGDGVATAHAAWILHRTGGLAPVDLDRLAAHPEALVRGHVQRVLGETPRWADLHRRLARGALADASPMVARAAVEALGRRGGTDDVRPVTDLLARADRTDTHLVHAARIGLRALVAPPGALMAAWDPARTTEATWLADVALGINTAEAGRIVAAYQATMGARAPGAVDRLKHAARFLPEPELEALMERTRAGAGDDLDTELAALAALLDGIGQRGGEPSQPVHGWARSLATRALDRAHVTSGVPPGSSAQRLSGASDLVGRLRLSDLAPRLRGVLADATVDLNARGRLARALAALQPSESDNALAMLADDRTLPAPTRATAAAAVAARKNWRTVWDEALRLAPQRVQSKLFRALASSSAGALGVLAVVEAGRASPRLLADRGLAEQWKSLPPAIQERRARLIADLPADSGTQALIEQRRVAFDPARAQAPRGAALFATTCALCHQIDGQGGVIGPQLDGAGARGLERLLEDVLDPNRNVDGAFQQHTVMLKNGDIVSGLPRREEGDVLIFADLTGREFPIPRKEIAQRHASDVSLMPDNFAELFTPAQLSDLMAFLLSRTVERSRPVGAVRAASR